MEFVFSYNINWMHSGAIFFQLKEDILENIILFKIWFEISNSALIFKRIFSVHQKIKRYFPILKFSSFSFNFLLYGIPAPSIKCHHPEAWQASSYRDLRGFSLTFQILTFERIIWFGGRGIGKYPIWFNITNHIRNYF